MLYNHVPWTLISHIHNAQLTLTSTAIYLLWEAAYYQNKNQLFEYFNYIFRNNKATCPNACEISLAGRRIIVTREPEHMKTILTSKFTQYGKGPEFHSIWEPFLGDSIFTTDGKLWQGSRSLIRPMFVKDKVRDLEIFDRWTDTLMAHIPSSGQTVDMCDLFYRMTLDVTTDFLLGASVGSLDK